MPVGHAEWVPTNADPQNAEAAGPCRPQLGALRAVGVAESKLFLVGVLCTKKGHGRHGMRNVLAGAWQRAADAGPS